MINKLLHNTIFANKNIMSLLSTINIKIILFTFFMALISSTYANNSDKAKEVFERSKQKMLLNNFSMIVDFDVYDKKANKKSKILLASFAEFDNERKILLNFTAPKDIAGIKVLTTDYANKIGLIEIYTPSTGRVQKIRANQHNLKVLGSRIPLNKLFNSKIDLNFDFTYLGKVPVNGINCHKIKLQRHNEKKYTIVYISVDKEYLLNIQKYNEYDKLLSITEISDYINVDTDTTKVYPREINIRNLKKGEIINMKIIQVEKLENINKEDFKLIPTN